MIAEQLRALAGTIYTLAFGTSIQPLFRKLDRCAVDGGRAMPDSETSLYLQMAAEELRRQAAEIDKRRAALTKPERAAS